MTSSIIWKLVLTGIVVFWTLANLSPIKDQEFSDFLRQEATAAQEELHALVEEAEAKANEAKVSTFVALRELIQNEGIDLAKFFPDLDVNDIKNVNKRNQVLLDHLLAESRGQLKLGLDLNGGVAFSFAISSEDLSNDEVERAEQIDKAVDILRDRVDAFGVAEPIIRPKGDDSIEIQMPGISTRDNPDVVKTLAAPARLKFSEVHRRLSPRSLDERPPPGYEILLDEEEDQNGNLVQIPLFIKKVSIMDGDIIKRAIPRLDEYGNPYVHIDFTSKGARQFAAQTRRISQENAGNNIGRLAIVLDGKLFSAPTVRDAIEGGTAVIEGSFTQREATELANVLNNPLKVGLEAKETYEVSPTLAKESRSASVQAGVIGAFLVLLFMAYYYRSLGLIAIFSLALNVFIVLGILASLGASLSLPGIAALVLTLGMAVDAQILIFERIREELRNGKQGISAIQSGFGKALSTIVDANVTTLITAIILIQLGAGPVKGFGVTLAIGIGTSIFCALVVTRLLLELLVRRRNSMLSLPVDFFANRKEIPFLNFSRRAFFSSWIIVGLGVVAIFAQGKGLLGIDFTGGDEISLQFEQPLETSEIEAVASANELGEVQVNTIRPLGAEKALLKLQTESDRGQLLLHQLQKAYPEAGLTLVGETKIGASVGKDVQRSALWSVLVALIGILLYVGLRFEWGYGFGAVIATVHDVGMTVGLYTLMGGQFSAPMVAAVLMILGYSINDTIVVFDRIREELKLDPETKLRAILHRAINRTLSRTVLTSITTLLPTLALYFLGAGVVVDFALVFLLGILTGTFSSIFIASPLFYWWHKGDRKHVEESHDILPKYSWEES